MDYLKYYNLLIQSRSSRISPSVKEDHHIVPKSLGGNNNKSNLVSLTPREHYIAHWLLYKIYSGSNKAKMATAFFSMCRKNANQKREISSKQYEIAKRAVIKSNSGENHPNFGKKYPKEFGEAISKRFIGSGNPRYGKQPWNKGLTKETSLMIKSIGNNLSNNLKSGKVKRKARSYNAEQKLEIAKRFSAPKTKEHKDKLSKANIGKKIIDRNNQENVRF